MPRGTTIWITGLPASGKTTLARALADALRRRGAVAVVIDGDEVRRTLSRDLGFDRAARDENVRRCAALAELVCRSEAHAVVALVSPMLQARAEARALHEESGLRFVEVYLSASLAVCEARDPKGLYAQARAGKLGDLTGLGGPYEPPRAAELVLDERVPVDESVRRVLDAMARGG